MNKKPNVSALNDFNSQRGEECKERVLQAINQCIAEKNLTTTRVCVLAGIHRSYFSKHPEMRKALEAGRRTVNKNLKKTKQNSDSRYALEKALRAEIAIKEKRIRELEKIQEYKALYEQKCLECQELEKQLDAAFRGEGLFNF